MDSTRPVRVCQTDHALTAFRAAARNPDQVALTYFDRSIDFGALDAASEALAARLQGEGVRPGDRLALDLQNTPAFVIGLLAGWKLGAIPVSINPMNRRRELTMLFADCAPSALLCQDTLYDDVVRTVPGAPAIVITSTASEWQSRNDARLFSPGASGASWSPAPSAARPASPGHGPKAG